VFWGECSPVLLQGSGTRTLVCSWSEEVSPCGLALSSLAVEYSRCPVEVVCALQPGTMWGRGPIPTLGIPLPRYPLLQSTSISYPDMCLPKLGPACWSKQFLSKAIKVKACWRSTCALMATVTGAKSGCCYVSRNEYNWTWPLSCFVWHVGRHNFSGFSSNPVEPAKPHVVSGKPVC